MERISSIAQDLLRFTQLDQADVQSFDVREGVSSALALLQPTVPDGVRIEPRLDPVPAIHAWPRELNHAFLTVIQNGVDAVGGDGTVWVETDHDDGAVFVRVRDDGRGMSADETAHFFDVTWSRGGSRASMRLGLSAAYATVQKHQGMIGVESAVGRGTTVTFRLPSGLPAGAKAPR